MKTTKKQNAAVAYTAIGSLMRQLQEIRDSHTIQACVEAETVTLFINKAMSELFEAQVHTGHRPNDQVFAKAATSLAEVLFTPGRPEGTIGHDGFALHVYIYGKTFRKFTQFATWESIPVVWHFGVSRPKAIRTA